MSFRVTQNLLSNVVLSNLNRNLDSLMKIQSQARFPKAHIDRTAAHFRPVVQHCSARQQRQLELTSDLHLNQGNLCISAFNSSICRSIASARSKSSAFVGAGATALNTPAIWP